MHDRSAMSGLLIQLVAICGIVVAVAGIIQGFASGSTTPTRA
ncbi:hypothetical protein QPX96_06460 [Limosilactobacillus fermentum]|nr:hypothetical protein [Limosilactobacillus fermentum]